MLQVYKNENNVLVEQTLATAEKGSWINLVNPTSEELIITANACNVPLDVLKTALDEEERSHVEIEDDYVLVITNIPLIRGKDKYDTLPLGMLITTQYFVTVCLEPNEVLRTFCFENARSFYNYKKTRFLFQILHKLTTIFLKYFQQINLRTDELEVELP